jgi:hypothetical protein
MEKIEIHSTSRHHAVSSDVVIRDGQVRLVFRPEIVDNPSNPAACVRGRFLYRRRGKNDCWEDFDKKPLSSFKKGEQYQLEISSGEMLPLLHELAALYRLHRAEGVPQGRLELVKIERQLAELLQLSEPELNDFLSANREDALRTLRRVLRWLAERPSTEENVGGEGAELPELNALVGLANLRAVLKTWRENSENADEGFWQGFLAGHAFVLSQLFAYPVVVIKDKAYVGGKRVDNMNGNLVDFLGRVSTSGRAVLIEIKTPETPLLGSRYRHVFPPSRELGGAMSQVLEYRESLMHEVHALNQGQRGELSGAEPRCVIIAGCAARQLTDDSQKRSFERFRERLAGVTVVTVDEVFDRIGNLVALFENSDRTIRGRRAS